MNRRSFLQLFAIALGSIWLPDVMRNASTPAMPLVSGWGVGVPQKAISEHGTWVRERALAVLQPGCWAHWYTLPHDAPFQTDGYLPMAYSAQWFNPGVATRRMATYPEETWLMLNEPERPDQGSMTPAQAVDFYEAFQAIAPPTLRYTAPGVAVGLLDYDGVAWLTAWRDGMQQRGLSMPRLWNIHMYPSGNLAECQRTWDRWQQWHAQHGDGKPIIISELCADVAPYSDQVAVMNWGRDRLAAEDVTAVLWYSAYLGLPPASHWPQCALATIDPPTRRVLTTPLGEHWQTLNQ